MGAGLEEDPRGFQRRPTHVRKVVIAWKKIKVLAGNNLFVWSVLAGKYLFHDTVTLPRNILAGKFGNPSQV